MRLVSLCILLCFSVNLKADLVPSSARSKAAIASVKTQLQHDLSTKGLSYGSPVFIRIFKDPGVFELWLENKNGQFDLFKSYDICYFSGSLGPKQKEGDNQSPEGFYFVTAKRFNPWSSYHLSFNLGYPNAYDRYHQRTGSALMVHGNCVSIGCYAMTDAYINEIYALTSAAINQGQSYFRVHIFPFRLEPAKLEQYKNSPWFSFWQNLKEGFDFFETHRRPPNIEVIQGRYQIQGS